MGCSARSVDLLKGLTLGKQSAPAAPNPQATAAAQEQVNTQTAIQNAELNRVDTTTPYGDLTYTKTGTNPDGTPIYSSNVSLSPQEQQLYNLDTQGQIGLAGIANGMQGQVANSYNQPLDYGGLPQVTSQVNGGQSYQAAQQQAQDAAYNEQTQYLNPQWQQSQSQLNSQLANQGITMGSNAYNTAHQNENLAQNQAYGNAQLQAVQAGNTEQNTLYGQGLSSANLQNSASQQGLSQLLAETDQPLNEYDALISGAQVQQPNFPSTPTANVANTDYAGIVNSAYQNQLAAYSANQASNPLNSLFSLGGSIGSALIMG